MLSVFSSFASWLVYSILGFDTSTKTGQSLHFFVEDTSKIFFLLLVMIYFIALIRASFSVELVRDYLSKKQRGIGYFLGSVHPRV